MTSTGRLAVIAVAVIALLGAADDALAQKKGGVLKLSNPGSPANMSMLELPTIQGAMPMMGVFNNLIMFDQHKAQVSLQTIVPDLASAWSWNEDGTALTFTLRQGIKWHDGKPFTAADVKCTWDLLLDKLPDKLRLNPRKTSYTNLEAVTSNGDYEVTFQLKRPQPAFPMLLAGAFSVIYPCHLSAEQMGSIRSAPARSNSSNSNRTKPSRWRGTPITGRRTGHTSTASSTRSSATRRPRRWHSCPASST
jgi:peptide/nickel transport system substrate-binding protein